MDLIPTLHTYAQDFAAQTVWATLVSKLDNPEGTAYYKHPSLTSTGGVVPDLCVLTRIHGVLPIRIVPDDFADIEEGEDTWRLDGVQVTSPITELEDIRVALQYRFDQDRKLRGRVSIHPILACPKLSATQLARLLRGRNISYFIARDDATLPDAAAPFSDDDWRTAQSLFQAAYPLSRPSPTRATQADQMGGAIGILERDIALLDDQQQKVALQIPPGPQQIRGLAGTGKTVLLAMKAATIHSHFPEASILFTFNTQSLYNQARDLITKFYRFNKESDPDWSRLVVQHGWGSRWKPGVYSDLCARKGATAINYQNAKTQDKTVPFRVSCRHALTLNIEPIYDYVLIDEAQDFPNEFFQMVYRLTKQPKCIYYAFDELQSLTAVDIPNVSDMFGRDDDGNPLISLDGEYPGPMDKDLILYKSYRSPLRVLMLAHGLGLGIHNPDGCVQMIFRPSTWQSIGYQVEGELHEEDEAVILRPPENSPNRIDSIYTGPQELIHLEVFPNRAAELEWVAAAVARDIQEDGVRPEHIVVISLDSISAKKYMSRIQMHLHDRNVASVIPGLIDDADQFAEPGRVTLATVHRAKGNEAPIVYVIAGDYLRQYASQLTARNRTFTSLSRSKAFVRLTGIGSKMRDVKREAEAILEDIPYFKFIVPAKEAIERNLDAKESTRRRKVVRTAEKQIEQLADLEDAALDDIDPELLEKLRRKLDRKQ